MQLFDPELRRAYHAAFLNLGIRLAPSASIQELDAFLRSCEITTELDGTMLKMTQRGLPCDVGTALRGLAAKPELKNQFIGAPGTVSHLSDLNVGSAKERAVARAKYIEENGIAAFTSLVRESSHPKRENVSFDPDRATREDAQAWTLAEKNLFLDTYGHEAYAKLWGRRDAK